MKRFQEYITEVVVSVKISSYSKGKGKGSIILDGKQYRGVWKNGKLISILRGMKKSPVKQSGDYYTALTEDGDVKFAIKELEDSISKLINK